MDWGDGFYDYDWLEGVITGGGSAYIVAMLAAMQYVHQNIIDIEVLRQVDIMMQAFGMVNGQQDGIFAPRPPAPGSGGIDTADGINITLPQISNVEDIRGVWMLGIEYTASAGLFLGIFGIRYNAATGRVSDAHGNSGIFNTRSLGTTVGTGLSAGVFAAYIDAPDVWAIQGGSIEFGLALDVTLGIIKTPIGPLEIENSRGFEIVITTGSERYYGFILTNAIGVSLPGVLNLLVSPHIQYSHTTIWDTTPNR